MIHRIQSLLLLLAAIVAIVLIFIPVGHIVDIATSQVLYEYDAFAVKSVVGEAVGVYSTAYIAILWAVSAILSLVTIFMYKNRLRQVSINGINMLVILAAMAMMLWVYPNLLFPKQQLVTERAIVDFNKWILLSIIPAVSLFFANRAIKKDERMVRAADRLR